MSHTPNHSEHGTLHRVTNFRTSTSGLFTLTNSLVISVTNNLTFVGINNVTSLDDTGFFQTVGEGAHYLSAGSTNRDAGTTNINPELLSALGRLTTYPPVVLTNHFTNSTTLTPQAQRDTDTPDLGYHPYPLDFVANQIAVSNATVTIQDGVWLGVYGSSSAPGLILLDGGSLISVGTPDNRNRIVRTALAQEKANTTWSASSMAASLTTVSPYGTNLLGGGVDLRFTELAAPANGQDHLYLGATNLTVSLQDCEFHGGRFTAVQPDVGCETEFFGLSFWVAF